LVYETPAPRTVEAFVEHLGTAEPLEVRLHLLGYYTRGHHIADPDTIQRAALGDAAAAEELLDAVGEWTDKRRVVDWVLGRSAAEVTSQLLDVPGRYPIGAAGQQPAEGGDRANLPGPARLYKALADERRLVLLDLLRRGPVTLGDAAREVGLSKSTTHHHLAILRQAGLVLIREDEERSYALRPEALTEVGGLLERQAKR
jgi:DNA-binding transcriptional ArsR family regulator